MIETKPRVKNATVDSCNQLETVLYGCIFDSRFGLYHVAVMLSFLRRISLFFYPPGGASPYSPL